ncbi:MAG: NAD(P)-binding domain-containing protein [Bacteroidota bacterium]|nr:NAD(P)-binding domain-containing protein [Bacteroidota bacterium]
MAIHKTIAIIGATGQAGSAIAERLAKSPHQLVLMSDETSKLEDLHKSVTIASEGNADIIALDCAKEASWEADLIILATPHERDREIAEKIRDVAVGKIVVSISDPNDQSRSELTGSLDSSAAEELQQMLPHSSVVTALNTTFAARFFTPIVDGKRADVLIAGNDADAMEEVSEVIQSSGYTTRAIGDLDMSSTLEHMKHILNRLGKSNYIWLAGWKSLENATN